MNKNSKLGFVLQRRTEKDIYGKAKYYRRKNNSITEKNQL